MENPREGEYTVRNADGDIICTVGDTDELCRTLRHIGARTDRVVVQIDDNGRVSELTRNDDEGWVVRTRTSSPNFTLIASSMAARLNADPLGLLTPSHSHYHAWLRSHVDHRLAPTEGFWRAVDPHAVSAMLITRHATHAGTDAGTVIEGWRPTGESIAVTTDGDEATLLVDGEARITASEREAWRIPEFQALLHGYIADGILRQPPEPGRTE